MLITEAEFDERVLRARRWLEAEGITPEMSANSTSSLDAGALVVRTLALLIEPGLADQGEAPPPFRVADWPELAERAHHRLTENARALAARVCGGSASAPVEALIRTQARRLAGLAADLLTSRPLAPPMRFPLDAHEAPQSAAYHVLLFEAWPHATHELWPLLVDALQASADGSLKLQAVAAHTSWLDGDGSLRRALWYDALSERLVEADLTPAKGIRSAHLLLGPGGAESAWHAHWSAWCAARGIVVVNPGPAALVADDKWAVYERWRLAGVPTPRTWLVPQPSTPGELHEFDERRANPASSRTCRDALAHEPRAETFIVKPRHGTEGRGVIACPADHAALLAALETLLRGELASSGDDALIQPCRGHLRRRDEADPTESRCATLRLHVALGSDARPVVESGYVHVGRDAASRVASVGQGGRLFPIVREELFLMRSEKERRPLTEEDTHRIVSFAEDAARALMDEEARGCLRLLGMDLLVEADEDGALLPLALEVNPRPAGLGHSRFLTPGWEKAGPPGVSLAIWEGRE